MFSAERGSAGLALFGVHEPDGPPARRIACAAPAVVRLLTREWITRVAGIQRAVGAPNDVDEMHAIF
jgi:hypothetical protein